MSIKTYSLKQDGNKKLSAHFAVNEFASRDGADQIKIDNKLVEYLERIRRHFGKPVTVTSGYRTPEHNAKVGGVKNSYHTKGMAADIVVEGVRSRDVARYAEAIGVRGIGWYESSNFTHIDTRSRYARWKDSGNNTRISFLDCPYPEPKDAISYGDRGNGVIWVQWYLRRTGAKIKLDGIFGDRTKAAIIKFQKEHSLEPDCIVGNKTRTALKKAVI